MSLNTVFFDAAHSLIRLSLDEPSFPAFFLTIIFLEFDTLGVRNFFCVLRAAEIFRQLRRRNFSATNFLEDPILPFSPKL
jgi:hypothetical protein